MYWWEDFTLSSYIFSDIEVGVRTPGAVPVPRGIFRKIILYEVLKKHPHLLTNHLWVRTQTVTWSWATPLDREGAPGQRR